MASTAEDINPVSVQTFGVLKTEASIKPGSKKSGDDVTRDLRSILIELAVLNHICSFME